MLQNTSGSLNDAVCGVEASTSLYHEAGQCMLARNIRLLFSSQPAWWNILYDNLKIYFKREGNLETLIPCMISKYIKINAMF